MLLCSNAFSCSGHGICTLQGQTLCDCNNGWSGFGQLGTFCTTQESSNITNSGSRNAGSESSSLWLGLMVSLPSAAFLGLCVLWYFKFHPERTRMLNVKSLLYQNDIYTNGNSKNSSLQKGSLSQSTEGEVCHFSISAQQSFPNNF